MKIERIPLSRLTTLGVGGIAEVWTLERPEELPQATEAPFRVLGNGSNLLVSDRGVPERVLRLGGVFRHWELEGWVGAGALLPSLVLASVRASLSGLEGLHGIPATVGGAVRMNAGTRFGEMAQALEMVELFHEGQFLHLSPEELGFGYRRSQLPPGAIVTRVRLKLRPEAPEEIQKRLAQVEAARKGQPKRKSAGCAFKNPPGASAGYLIDRAGLKGRRIGQACISKEHGNFLVNLGGAQARDFWLLVEEVRRVLPLELEWEVWGEV